MNFTWITEQCFDLFFQAYGEIPATALINRTAIDIAMQDVNEQQEDFLFDFATIWDDKANRASRFSPIQYRMIVL